MSLQPIEFVRFEAAYEISRCYEFVCVHFIKLKYIGLVVLFFMGYFLDKYNIYIAQYVLHNFWFYWIGVELLGYF